MSTVMFWSPQAGHGKTSSHTALVTLTAALQYRLRILVCHNQAQGESIESGLMAHGTLVSTAYQESDIGIDSVRRLLSSRKLNKNNISDYTIPLLKDRLDLLPGTMIQSNQTVPDKDSDWQDILNIANEYYDLVIVDIGSGMDKVELLKYADGVVVNMSQNINHLESFFTTSKQWASIHQQPWTTVLGAYDPDSKCTISNIRRKYSLKQNIFAIENDAQFRDAWNVQTLLPFVRRNLGVAQPRKYVELFKQATMLTEHVLEQLNEGHDYKRLGEGKLHAI
ncbi:hypothetical protein PO903_18145 [Paenibacillus sp. PK4536]|uniref:hypothetical protein n=1 Tax=Paenibacillus sp. PK4536 TaxID=3024576 RepID=UPI0023596DBD|nr:hypothetical protein [Paenibacillus sp. PK4536]WIM38550.1 hypothetical protein PO903_18145 [Paenibacillus sp. PK4536]